MWREVLQCLLDIQLRADAPPEVAGNHAGKAPGRRPLLCFPVSVPWRTAIELCTYGCGCARNMACVLLLCFTKICRASLSVGGAVVELCRAYDHALGGDACSKTAAQHCIHLLGSGHAVPAAVVLHSLLTQIWRKPVSVVALPCLALLVVGGCSWGAPATPAPWGAHEASPHLEWFACRHAPPCLGQFITSSFPPESPFPAHWVPPCRSACAASWTC